MLGVARNEGRDGINLHCFGNFFNGKVIARRFGKGYDKRLSLQAITCSPMDLMEDELVKRPKSA